MRRLARWIDLRYATAAVMLGIASLLLGVLAHVYATFPGDEAANATVRKLGDGFEPVAYVFNELNTFISFGVAGVVLAGLAARRRLHLVATVAVVLALRPTLDLMKPLVNRPRPSGDFPVLDTVHDSSFPSGHTMTAATVFALLYIFAPVIFPRRLVWMARALAVAGTALMAMSRMWAGVHWFSDTWGAVVWALALVMAVLALRPTFEAVGDRVRGPLTATLHRLSGLM